MNPLMALGLFVLGIFVGCFPAIGQIIGGLAWSESCSGSEIAGEARTLAFGTAAGTILLIVAFLRFF